MRKGGKGTVLGLVLTEPSEKFFELVAALQSENPAPKMSISEKAAASRPAVAKGELAAAPRSRSWRSFWFA